MIGHLFIMIATILGIWGWLKKDNTSKWLTTVAIIGILLVGVYDIYDRTISGQEIKRLEQMAESPVLTVLDYTAEQTDEGFSIIIRFNKSKNELLGITQFIAILSEESTATIIDLWPIGEGITSTGKDSKKISSDGKIAFLTYQTVIANPVQIRLVTSEKTEFVLQGNYIKDAIKFSIK